VQPGHRSADHLEPSPPPLPHRARPPRRRRRSSTPGCPTRRRSHPRPASLFLRAHIATQSVTRCARTARWADGPERSPPPGGLGPPIQRRACSSRRSGRPDAVHVTESVGLHVFHRTDRFGALDRRVNHCFECVQITRLCMRGGQGGSGQVVGGGCICPPLPSTRRGIHWYASGFARCGTALARTATRWRRCRSGSRWIGPRTSMHTRVKGKTGPRRPGRRSLARDPGGARCWPGNQG
jgi:hypothetical protein